MTTIKWQPEQSALLDITPQYLIACKIWGGQMFSFPTLLDSYRELLLNVL